MPDRTLSPANPDANQHAITTGVGYNMGSYDFDFFYAAGFFEGRRVDNAILSGYYSNFAHYFGLGMNKSF